MSARGSAGGACVARDVETWVLTHDALLIRFGPCGRKGIRVGSRDDQGVLAAVLAVADLGDARPTRRGSCGAAYRGHASTVRVPDGDLDRGEHGLVAELVLV